MNLKVICQICGKTRILDTVALTGDEPRWESYELQDVIQWIDKSRPTEEALDAFKDYEIWICDICHDSAITNQYPYRDEVAGICIETEYDFEKLGEKVINTLFGRVLVIKGRERRKREDGEIR